MKLYVVIGAVILAAVVAVAVAAPAKRFFIAPLYIEYSLSSDAEFAKEVRELRERIGDEILSRAGQRRNRWRLERQWCK